MRTVKEASLPVTHFGTTLKPMKIWEELNENVKKSTKSWASWARQHAQEIGEAGMRHIERQDLLTERRQLHQRLGSLVATRFIVEEKKTLRAETGDVQPLLERLSAIEARLTVLEEGDRAEGADGTAGDGDDAPRS